MTPETPTLADFLQQLMQARNLSAADIAKQSGVKEPWLSLALAGQYVNPTARIICALAGGLGMTPQDVIGPICRTEHILRPLPSPGRGRGRKPATTPQPD